MCDSSPSAAEGVIRFDLEHRTGPLPADADIGALRAWFARCRALGGLGRYPPERFGGAAFGNLSRRCGEGFLVTGTQTGSRDALGERDIAWVRHWDVARNRVVSQGPARPSSESLTHGQIYALRPDAGFVIHIHDPLLWRHADALGLPITDPAAEYGTPEMARAVAALLSAAPAAQGGFAMGGHEDGLVFYGKDAERAGLAMLACYGAACRHIRS